jgi:hypothetical protein
MGTKPKTLQDSLKNGTPITASIRFFKMPYKQQKLSGALQLH